MRKFLFQCYLIIALLAVPFCAVFGFDGHPTLPIGADAPDFSLPGVDGKTYSLQSFKGAKVLAIVFMCNHCPSSQAYEDRIIKIAGDYAAKGVKLVGINPNNPASIRLDELGYTDLGDTFEEMKIRAKDKDFDFPYLFDGETETASLKYGPIATPHIFIFDENRKLRYSGRIDDVENPRKTPHSLDARNAIDALLNHKEVPVTTTKVFGCSIKWAEKSDWIAKAAAEWAKEPVKLDTINQAGIADILKNNSEKLRLINVWATWCGPCVEEFTDFITMNRMYRGRDFEFISITADDPDHKDKALKFLQKKEASNTNYIFSTDDKYKLIEAIDPKWQGALPYTMLVEPGGKVVYAHQGIIDPLQLKKLIVDDPVIGRVYK